MVEEGMSRARWICTGRRSNGALIKLLLRLREEGVLAQQSHDLSRLEFDNDTD